MPKESPERHDDLRISDVKTFLDVYDQSKRTNFESFNSLFGSLDQAATTIIGKLERVTGFLFTDRNDLKPKSKGPGFEALFELTDEEGLKPTPAADELALHFNYLKDISAKARTRFQDVLSKNRQRRTVVHLGATQTIANRLLSCVYSPWAKIISKNDLDFRIEVATSAELVQRLGCGAAIDAVIAYGMAGPATMDSTTPENVRFHSLGFKFSMTLLCHPDQPPLAKHMYGQPRDKAITLGPQPKDIQRMVNECDLEHHSLTNYVESPITDYYGYLSALRFASKSCKPTASADCPSLYEHLFSICPQKIDLSKTQLIVAPSHAHPPGLVRIIEEARRRGGVREAESYDEALSLVRAGQGIAFTSELFCACSGVNAFKLEPVEDYQRSVGIYHNVEHPWNEKTLLLLRFLCAYLQRFANYIRATGNPPAYKDTDFERFCNQYPEGVELPVDWQSIEELAKSTSLEG